MASALSVLNTCVCNGRRSTLSSPTSTNSQRKSSRRLLGSSVSARRTPILQQVHLTVVLSKTFPRKTNCFYGCNCGPQ
ncbi:hypothetical protein MUK42_36447 [Musa troglodytarum]|uniref:Uncharacterized protein n=1 Tax=Musa troglodytarum TaxID=320322 RepID=A0A9E7E8W1_9LILI|nr:hypothetical protein MUK42_36447 [Musa troglodytarum]